MLFRKHYVYFLLALAPCWINVVKAECVNMPTAWVQMQFADIVLLNSDGTQFEFNVRIADEPYERRAGYQHVCPSTGQDSAILFVFRKEIKTQFHMRNVYLDLDIAFIDANGTVIDVQKMRAEPPGVPLLPRLYGPNKKFQYVLEAPAGLFEQHNIRVNHTRLML